MPDRIISVIGGSYNPSEVVDVPTEVKWGQTDRVNTINSVTWLLSDDKKYVTLNIPLPGSIGIPQLNVTNGIVWNEFSDKITTVISLEKSPVYEMYIGFDLGSVITTSPVEVCSWYQYYGILPWIDESTSDTFSQVYIYEDKPTPLNDLRYLPVYDFNFLNEEINFTADFIDPINFDSIRTRLSPVNTASKLPWSRSKVVDIYQQLKWGYGINNFLVGGSVNTYHRTDQDAITPPPEPPLSQEVISFVNIVNIVKLPERTVVRFDNLSLSYDVDSIAWNVSFDVADKSTYNLVKPSKNSVVELEININNELFNVFIGKTSTTTSVDASGKVQRRIKCQGWSVHKLLTHPYHVRRSHVETSPATPAGILSAELTGTGFTATWDTVSWTLPANTFTYIDKAPIAALSDLVQSVGAVIIPTPDAKSFSVKPRYPISPWSWSGVGADINLNENSFFSIDTEWFPQESPDSVYVYGESSSGVAVKCVRAGQPGTITLPTVVSSYFTDTIPAVERGRIEVAKNGYKEIVPISTYVDPVDGILMPLQLVNVTEADNLTNWRGLVVGVTLNLKRNGNALVQTIQLERHYDI